MYFSVGVVEIMAAVVVIVGYRCCLLLLLMPNFPLVGVQIGCCLPWNFEVLMFVRYSK